MTDRTKRLRRQISELTEDSSNDSESGSGEDWDPRGPGMGRVGRKYEASASSTPSVSRPRRTAAAVPANGVSSATVYRSTSGSTDDRRQSIRLTVKVPPSKLREVMRANEVESLQDTLGGGQIIDGPRNRNRSVGVRTSSRTAEKPRYVEYGDSDIDDEDEEDEEEQDEEEEEEEGEEEEGEDDEGTNDFDEIGAEPEGGTDEEDEDGDVTMSEAPPPKQHSPPKPPKITLKTPSKPDTKQPLSKPKVIITPAQNGPVKSVEEQEIEDDPDDEELEEAEESSVLSEEEANKVNEDDAEGEEELDEEEDAEGEDEDIGGDEEADADADSDDETPASGMATPSFNRMTKRQRGRPEDQNGLMALDMAPQQRKFFTDEEKAMKKDEHARKRKELTKRKTQEEKAAALNRLLKPQASKSRGGVPKPETLAAAAAAAAGSQADDDEGGGVVEKPNPLFTRWVSNKDGIKLGVPEEWLGKKVGAVFGPPPGNNYRRSNKLIEEID